MATNVTGILDEFTEVISLGNGRYKYTSFTRSGGSRGPFRQVDGSWGSIRDLFDATLENDVDIIFTRGAHGVRISPFIRFGGQDRYVRDVIAQFPGAVSRVDYERHGLKYSASFIDTLGRLQGLGFDFSTIGDVTLRADTQDEIIGGDENGNPITWPVPVAIVSYRGVEIVRIAATPLLKPADPEWRPYRQGTKVRIDLARMVGRVVEIDPTTTIYTDNDINGYITFTFPSTPISATNTGTFKQVGRRIFPTAQRYNSYDRFDTTLLDANAIVTDVILHWRASLTPYTQGGDGPSNAVWKFYQAWNKLTDPLNSADLFDVRDAAGALTTEIDSDEIQDPASKEFYEFPLNPSWIRGGTSELHDLEVYDHSAYDAGDARIWSIERTSDQPYLEIIYVLPPTIAMNSALLTLDPQDLDVVPVFTLTLNSAVITLDPQDLDVVAIFTQVMNSATIAINPQDLDVIPGSTAVVLDAATLFLNPQDVLVSTGAVSISMQSVVLLLDPQTLNKVLHLHSAGITINPQATVISSGTAVVELNAAMISILAQDFIMPTLGLTCPVLGSKTTVHDLLGNSAITHGVLGDQVRVHAVMGDSGCEHN
jgi:hypothetical protein